MHTINIDGLDWTSKEEIKINGVVYVRKDTLPKVAPLQNKVIAKIRCIQPNYLDNNQNWLRIMLADAYNDMKMPSTSKLLKPGDTITIIKGAV